MRDALWMVLFLLSVAVPGAADLWASVKKIEVKRGGGVRGCMCRL